jgi:uncharacterized membrane protein
MRRACPRSGASCVVLILLCAALMARGIGS